MTPENAREMMSFIFQDATLLPWRTVEENVGLGLELEYAARPLRKERVAKMLELVGLEHVARQLSAATLGRHEDARLDCARAGEQAAHSADGRAVCGAGRDDARPAERRVAAACMRSRNGRCCL